MEDFSFARRDEREQSSALLTEWLEAAKPNFANNTDIYLSFANTASDKQEPAKDRNTATEKPQAERLDKELKDFATAKLEDPSHSMQRFQKAVDNFCKNPDKEAAMDDLSDVYASLVNRMKIGVEALYNDRKEEIARQPGRKELDANFKGKQDDFFGKMLDLPFEESRRVEDMMKWQDGETKAQHRDRIRKGLANNKTMLDSFDQMSAAEDKIEASKSPREKQLDYLLKQIDTDDKTMQELVEKAYVRSSLK